MHVHTTSFILIHEAPYSLPRGLFPCYSQWLPVSLSRPIVLLQDLSSCRMTRSGHEVPVFTVQSPALNVVPLPPQAALVYLVSKVLFDLMGLCSESLVIYDVCIARLSRMVGWVSGMVLGLGMDKCFVAIA